MVFVFFILKWVFWHSVHLVCVFFILKGVKWRSVGLVFGSSILKWVLLHSVRLLFVRFIDPHEYHLCSESCSSVRPSGQMAGPPTSRPSCITTTLMLDITHKLSTIIFIPLILIGTVDLYHFIPLSVTLTFVAGHKVSTKQDLLATFSRTLQLVLRWTDQDTVCLYWCGGGQTKTWSVFTGVEVDRPRHGLSLLVWRRTDQGTVCLYWCGGGNTTELYGLIPVWITFVFSQGQRVAGKPEPVSDLADCPLTTSVEVCGTGRLSMLKFVGLADYPLTVNVEVCGTCRLPTDCQC